MTRETIRDYNSRVIGYIETDAQGNQTAKDFYNVILGRYDTRRNVTTDFRDRILARGNILTALIYNANAEREKANRLKPRRKPTRKP